MKVLLLTDDDPIYLPRYLEPIVKEHGSKFAEIIIAPNPDEDFLTTIRKRYAMLGFVPLIRFGIRYVIGTFLSLLPTAIIYDVFGQYYSVRDLGKAHDISVHKEEDINDPEFVARVRQMDPDLILSISCSQKLGTDLLEVTERNPINVHGSLLPKYRGRATAFWVLYHDEEESGVTAHLMTDEFDGGDILLRRRFQIEQDDAMHDVYEKIVETGSSLVAELLEKLAADEEFEPEPNPTEEGEYYTLPNAENRREFLRRGNEFI